MLKVWQGCAMRGKIPIKRKPGSQASRIAALAESVGVSFNAARRWFESGQTRERIAMFLNREAAKLPREGRPATKLPSCLN